MSQLVDGVEPPGDERAMFEELKDKADRLLFGEPDEIEPRPTPLLGVIHTKPGIW